MNARNPGWSGETVWPRAPIICHKHTSPPRASAGGLFQPQRPQHTRDVTAHRASRSAVTAKVAAVSRHLQTSSEMDADVPAAVQPVPIRGGCCHSSGTGEGGLSSAVQRSCRETTCTEREKQSRTYELCVRLCQCVQKNPDLPL